MLTRVELMSTRRSCLPCCATVPERCLWHRRQATRKRWAVDERWRLYGDIDHPVSGGRSQRWPTKTGRRSGWSRGVAGEACPDLRPALVRYERRQVQRPDVDDPGLALGLAGSSSIFSSSSVTVCSRIGLDRSETGTHALTQSAWLP